MEVEIPKLIGLSWVGLVKWVGWIDCYVYNVTP